MWFFNKLMMMMTIELDKINLLHCDRQLCTRIAQHFSVFTKTVSGGIQDIYGHFTPWNL